MGDGDRVNFWYDIWLDGRAMRARFPRIFVIARHKDIFVEEVFTEGEGRRE